MVFDNDKCMINAMTSPDGLIHSFSALPYKNEVLDFLSIDPMVWIVVIVLGILSSALAIFRFQSYFQKRLCASGFRRCHFIRPIARQYRFMAFFQRWTWKRITQSSQAISRQDTRRTRKGISWTPDRTEYKSWAEHPGRNNQGLHWYRSRWQRPPWNTKTEIPVTASSKT